MHRQIAARRDITARLLSAHLHALGTQEFEFGIKNSITKRMIRRHWSYRQALHHIRWLKYSNVNGHHIYVRPAGADAIVLVDDLVLSALLQMDRDGVNCAAVVETSPQNFQAWVRVSNKTLDPVVATCLGEILAGRYDGDQGSKDFRHLGRAVGFTNVKAEHIQESGLYPYVKLIEHEGRICHLGISLIEEAITLAKAKQDERDALRKRLTHRSHSLPDSQPETCFLKAVSYINKRYGKASDNSRADASAALHMLHQGYDQAAIERAMCGCESIQARKVGHVEDYVKRTLNWALNARKKNGE